MRLDRNYPRDLIKVLFLFIFVATFTFLALKLPNESSAARGEFKAGNIISDYMMSKSDSMTVAEIDAFLHEKGNCNNTDTYMASWYPSVHYHIEGDHYVCLADERFADGTLFGDLIPEGTASKTAAEIIYEVAQEYAINPQVLIVLLEKEQGLISDSWPNSLQYRSATGYGCPDTAACDSKYYGFKNQLKNAAALFRTVLNGGWTNYPVGENFIYYNPNRDCGGSTVNIENLATSALYRYTPYQPNEASLSVGYGTAYCGAYGNRNFFYLFSDWFGDPTVGQWAKMMMPRSLYIASETQYINPISREIYSSPALKVGDKISFSTKIDITWNGKQEACLRNDTDSEDGVNRCILMSMTSETRPATTVDNSESTDNKEKIVEIIEPTRLTVIKNTSKIILDTQESVQEINTADYTKISFSEKVIYNSETYYRTTYDVNNNNDFYISASALANYTFVDFLYPRNLEFKQDTDVKSLGSETLCYTVKGGTVKRFTTKIDLDGKTYYRNENDSNSDNNCVVAASDVTETSKVLSIASPSSLLFVNFLFPRALRLRTDADSVDPVDGTVCESYSKGTIKNFATKLDIGGKTYFRTKEDTGANLSCAFLSTDLEEL